MSRFPWRWKLIAGLALAAVLMLAGPAPGAVEEVRLPIRLDYDLLRSLFMNKVYTEPGGRAVALDADQGCTRIELWEPTLAPEGRYLRLGTRIMVRAGAPLGQTCLQPVKFEGYIEVVQRPYVDERTWALRFETIDSRLYNPDRERSRVGRVLWDLLKTELHAYLDQIRFDLSPPVDEIRTLLPAFFQTEDRLKVARWLESIRPGPVTVSQDAVRAGILMEVEAGQPAGTGEMERELTEEELNSFVELWESWDSFLIHQIKSIADKPLTPEEKQAVFDTVIETRHHFIRVLSTRSPGRDLVRQQFIYAWQNLAPIFRKYLGGESSGSLLSYLAFFTAADALTALDKLGPTLGLEISRNGLIRMARLVSSGQELPLLSYDYQVDPELRSVMGLGPALAGEGPALPEDSISAEDLTASAGPGYWLRSLGRWLVPTAQAATNRRASLEEIRSWLVTRNNFETYLPRVRELLGQETAKVLAESDLDAAYHNLFGLMIQAICWQESCFRHFKVSQGRIRYIRSYDNSSVGLMQINERVWRKLYNRDRLRWDIRYNAAAGCRIMERYLTRYVLRRMAQQGLELDDDVLARMCYAMYNGGPSQFAKFLKRHDRAKYYRSDLLFYEKYNWARFDEWEKLRGCLF